MVIKIITLTYLFLFFGAGFVFADSSPVLLNPFNNSTITQTSPKLSWDYSGECYTKGSCYYVEVDDSESFSGIDKYIYTNNKYYTPKNLSYKKWFWHVKAKNPSGIWSAMSDTWSFTIEAASPSPIYSPTPVPSSPTPSSNPEVILLVEPQNTPTPTQTITPTAKPSSQFSAYSYLRNKANLEAQARLNQATAATNQLSPPQKTQPQTASVAAVTSAATKPYEPVVKPNTQANLIRITGFLLILSGSGATTYILLKSRLKSKAI